jgi:hypothetical protein
MPPCFYLIILQRFILFVVKDGGDTVKLLLFLPTALFSNDWDNDDGVGPKGDNSLLTGDTLFS